MFVKKTLCTIRKQTNTYCDYFRILSSIQKPFQIHWSTYKRKVSNSCNTYSYYLENGIQDTGHTAWPVLMESFHPMWYLLTEVCNIFLLGDSLSVQRADTPERCCVELCEGHAYSHKLENLTGILISCSKYMNFRHYLLLWNNTKF